MAFLPSSGAITAPLDAFGLVTTGTPTQVIDVSFPYGFNPQLHVEQVKNSGAVAYSPPFATIHANANGDFATVRSVKRVRHNPGLAVQFSFTAVFTNGVAGTTQYVGMGDPNDGLFFGYTGATFGVLRRHGGLSHVQQFDLSGTLSDTGGVDVTLDSDTVNIPVDNGSSAYAVARTVANATQTFMDTGDGWTVSALGASLTFVSTVSGPKAGTFSLAATGITVDANTTVVTGVAATDTVVNQADWNVDPADGTGALPALDWSKGNVFRIAYQWLGFGMIYFSVENPSTGKLTNVHRIQYSGSATTTSIAAPNQPYAAMVTRTAAAAPVSVSVPSGGAFVTGQFDRTFGPRYGVSASYDGTINTAQIHLLSVFNPLAVTTAATLNRSELRVLAITLFAGVANSTKEHATFTVYRNAQQALTPSDLTWTSAGTYSLAQYNVTNNTRVADSGLQIADFVVAFQSDTYIDGTALDIIVPPGDQVSIYVQASGNVTGASAAVGLSWVERL